MQTEFSSHPQPVEFPYNTYRAICKEVYDGDTFTVLVDLGFYTYTTVRVRLLGVDTAEIRGGTTESKQLVKQAVCDIYSKR
jgi:micrococcal nuclease